MIFKRTYTTGRPTHSDLIASRWTCPEERQHSCPPKSAITSTSGVSLIPNTELAAVKNGDRAAVMGPMSIVRRYVASSRGRSISPGM